MLEDFDLIRLIEQVPFFNYFLVFKRRNIDGWLSM